MTRILYRDEPTPNTVNEPVALGGTDSSTASVALNALNLIKATDVGHPFSAVPLGADGIVPAEFLGGIDLANGNTLDANLSVYTLVPAYFTISNYDYQRTYTITVTAGTVELVTPDNPVNSLAFGTIIYTPPNTVQPAVLSINGRQYPLQVLLSYVEKPTFTWPANNAVISILHPVLEASLFACVGYQDEQLSSTFEYATDSAFTNIITTRFNDSGQGESGPFNEDIANLSAAGDYYVRVKYEGLVLGESVWSDTLHIERQIPVSYPTTEVDILHRPNIATVLTGGLFGINAALSPDGTLLAISDPNVNVQPQLSYPNELYGEIYIYKKINNTWVYQTAINSGKSDSGFIDFGSSIRITPDNQFIIVGSGYGRYSAYKGEQSGIVQIFKTLVHDDYSTLFITNYIDATPNDYNNTNLGLTISLSANGQILAVTSAGNPNHAQRVLIHTFDGISAYVPSAIITNPFPTSFSAFAAAGDMALSPNGDRLLVSDRTGDNGNGCIYVYDYDGVNWNLTDTITIGANIVPTSALVFSSHKDKFAYGVKVYDLLAQGRVSVYEHINNVWSITHYIEHTDWNSYTLSGDARVVVFTPDDQSLIVGSPLQTALNTDIQQYGTGHADGAVYRFKLTGQGNAWNQEFKYTASDLNPALGVAYFGNFILLNNTDNEMIIGSKYKDWGQNSNEVGAVYIFR